MVEHFTQKHRPKPQAHGKEKHHFFFSLIVNSSVLTMNLKVFERPQRASITMWAPGVLMHVLCFASIEFLQSMLMFMCLLMPLFTA